MHLHLSDGTVGPNQRDLVFPYRKLRGPAGQQLCVWSTFNDLAKVLFPQVVMQGQRAVLFPQVLKRPVIIVTLMPVIRQLATTSQRGKIFRECQRMAKVPNGGRNILTD